MYHFECLSIDIYLFLNSNKFFKINKTIEKFVFLKPWLEGGEEIFIYIWGGV